MTRLTFRAERYTKDPVEVTVTFTLPADTPVVRAKDFGDIIKAAIADGEFVEGDVIHHYPESWPKPS